MRVKIYIEITGPIDSLMLWEIIKDYKLNLTDLGHVALVYGDCGYFAAGYIISKCALFGNLKVRIVRGCEDEQEKTEE